MDIEVTEKRNADQEARYDFSLMLLILLRIIYYMIR